MATISFSLKGTNSLRSIYVKLYFKDEYDKKHNIYKNTGLQVLDKDWNKNTKRPKATNDTNKILKNHLNNLEDFIIEVFNDDLRKDTIIDKDWLELQLNIFFKRTSLQTKTTDLLTDNIQELINTASIRPNGKKGIGLSKNRINQYKGLKTFIEEFQAETKKKYRVKDVNKRFAVDFLSYLTERMYATSYQQKKLSDIKVVCNNARSNGIEVSLQLQDIKITNVSNEYINYLNEKEIAAIDKLELNDPAMNNARKWILLGCYTGQRGNDLVNLTEKNIVAKNGRKYIEVKQEKTSKPIFIPVHTKVEEIIKDGFPYHLNINGERGLNKRMKQIGKLAKIDEVIEGKKYDNEKERVVYGKYPKHELMRTHDLRRSFATNLYGKLPTTVIRAITGHSTEQMLLKYIGKTNIDMAEQLADYYEKEELKAQNKAPMTVLRTGTNQ